MESLFDKVIFAKNRVWTIYGTDPTVKENGEPRGVWCYQGLKPYAAFNYDSYRHGDRFNTNYFHLEEVSFLEGEEIDKKTKEMEREDKKKLTRKKAIDFFVYLTGHSKAFVTKNIETEKRYVSDTFEFSPGAIHYEIWKTEGAILLSENMKGTTRHCYFDFITFEPHDRLNDKSDKAYREQIIGDFKDWKGIE